MPPVRAKLVRDRSYFVVGKTHLVKCRVVGSHPSAYVKASIAGREVAVERFEQEGQDGDGGGGDANAVVFTLKFVPRKEDHGSLLSCRLA